jgi:hypothetical protein
LSPTPPPNRRRSAPLAPSLHATVAGTFFAFGVGLGLWGGASGAILARARVDPAAFGVILTLFTAAYLIAMSASGALSHAFGVSRVLPVLAIVLGVAQCALLNAFSATGVAIGLIAMGFLGGVVDVTMNAEGARIECRLGRPILARLHAAASAGMAVGAILGSLIVASAAPWVAGALAALGLAASGLAYDRAARADPPPPSSISASSTRALSFAPVLIGLGVVIGVSIAAETAALLWSTLLLRAEAPRLAAIAGLGGAFFSACQATLRFNADAIRARVSDPRIIVVSLAIAASGFAIVGVHAGFVASVAGFAVIGVGTGPIIPCSFALAARQPGAGPAVGLASASLFSALTRLPAPLATGAIAQSLSLPAAFAAFAVALVATAVAAGVLAPANRDPGSTRDS